jgi:hypothetical protein
MKEEKYSYILELKLVTECWQEHILHTRFDIARKLYNMVLSYALKQTQRMKESKQYRQHLRSYRNAKKKLLATKNKKEKASYEKELKHMHKTLTESRKSFSLDEYKLHAYVKKHQHNYKKHIDSNTFQKIASTVWKAMEKVLFEGKRAHFKKYGALKSVEGKSNSAGIRFKENTLYWNGLVFPVRIRKNDLFIKESLLTHKIKYCRIIKKEIQGKDVYYVQLVMDGVPPDKRINSTGAFRHHKQQNERVGIDIGTSTIAIVSEKKVLLQQLVPGVPLFEKKKRRLLRKLDRSRRHTNKANYNEDGTVKRGIRLQWVRSKNYFKTLYQLKELSRQKAVYIKEKHGALTNTIFSLGDEVYIEKMNFSALAKRSKETKQKKDGTYQSKKRFGKSIHNHSPAMLVNILKRKLLYTNLLLQEVNTHTFKASQYNHVLDEYKKKKLHERWSRVGKHVIQRDIYSAFLLMNSDDSKKYTDKQRCMETFPLFITLHDDCIQNLEMKNTHLPSSMGIKKIN